MKTISVIGLGSIGVRHAKNLLSMGHKVYGLDKDMTRQEECRAAGGEELPVPFNRTLERSDGVIIATPSNNHIDTIAYVGIDIPIFVEKPIGVSQRDLECLKRFIPTVMMVGNNLRFRSCVIKAKEWLDDGLIGSPIWADFTLAQHNTKYHDHVILNWGAHELDLATYLLGPAEVAACVGCKEIANVDLLHGNGCRTAVHLDYLTPLELRGFVICGQEGRIVCNVARNDVLFYRNNPIPELVHTGADSFDDNYITEMQAFIDRIDNKETRGATMDDGIKTLELCLEAIRMCNG